jgi:hypothetical protein
MSVTLRCFDTIRNQQHALDDGEAVRVLEKQLYSIAAEVTHNE